MISRKLTGGLKVTILLVLFLISTMVVFAGQSMDTGIDSLSLPHGLAYLEKDSILIIADTQNHRILSYNVKTGKTISAVGITKGEDRFGQAGGGYVDGPLAKAMFNHPRGVAVAENGAIFVADTGNHAIRQIWQGRVTTVAGGKTAGFKDGTGTEASFLNPAALAIDSKGEIYVADTLNNAIRKIDTKGKVTTFYGGEGLNEPAALAIDKDGNIYVADGGNHQIKVISPQGKLSLMAGKTFPAEVESGYSVGDYKDGIALEAEFNFPKGLVLKGDGTLLVADTFNHLIRGIKDEKVYTVAGTDSAGTVFTDRFISFFNEPTGLAYGNSTLFVADRQNNRIVAIPDKDEVLSKPLDGIKKDGEILIFLDGEEVVSSDAQAYVGADEEVMVPIRSVMEKWGASVGWDNEKRMVSIVKAGGKDGQKVELYLGKGDFVLVNGRSLTRFEVFEKKLGFNMDSMAGGEIVLIESK